jgi:hypothetical protein
MLAQEEISQSQERVAMQRYHARYDNRTFTRATQDKTSAYANALIDEALAICGHPWYGLSHRHWTPEAVAFLRKFGR